MTIGRPKRRGSYAPLAARYYEDEAVMNAGPSAELLFVRSLAFSAASMSDGFIGDAQVRAIGRDVRRLGAACAALVQWKLWQRDQSRGGYWITNWLKWNPSAEDISAAREADRARKHGKNSGRNPNGKAPESGRRPPGIRSTDTDAHTETDTESSDRTPAGPVRSDATGRRGRDAPGGAPRPPANASWRELNDPARRGQMPDLSGLRKQLAAAPTAKNGHRPDPLGELSRLVREYGPESESGGSQ